jgi:hypothetical protein
MSLGSLAVLLGISMGICAQSPDSAESEGTIDRQDRCPPLDWILKDPFGRALPGTKAPVTTDSDSLEEIARLLDTPRWKPSVQRKFGGTIKIDDPVDPKIARESPCVVTDGFSAMFNNGAPFVLFNWSRGDSALPNAPLRLEGQKHVAVTKTDLDVAAISSKVALREPDDPLDPGRRRNWETDETVRMSLPGPLFVFGQFGAATDWVDQQQAPKWQGKYGVGVKLKPWFVDEVQVRGGPAVRSDDTGRWVRGPSGERSEMFLEAVTKVGIPVVGPINFEYTSTAVPPAVAGERSLFNQDLKVARPLARGGQVHLGAKLRADDVPITASWVDRMQVYMGFELKR